jgi:hypothetical protein
MGGGRDMGHSGYLRSRGGGAYLIGVHKPGGSLRLEPLNDLLRNQATIHSVYMGSSDIKRAIFPCIRGCI